MTPYIELQLNSTERNAKLPERTKYPAAS